MRLYIYIGFRKIFSTPMTEWCSGRGPTEIAKNRMCESVLHERIIVLLYYIQYRTV